MAINKNSKMKVFVVCLNINLRNMRIGMMVTSNSVQYDPKFYQ